MIWHAHKATSEWNIFINLIDQISNTVRDDNQRRRNLSEVRLEQRPVSGYVTPFYDCYLTFVRLLPLILTVETITKESLIPSIRERFSELTDNVSVLSVFLA